MPNNPSSSPIQSFVAGIENDLVELRHELHQIPEPGLQLPRTVARLRPEFEALGLEISDATSVTGFCAVLRGGRGAGLAIHERPVVLLRADMDGLPVAEQTGLAWASTNGAMHGCGHDVHMAGLVGAARALAAIREELAGDVVFFLQPGEESWDGAQHMIDEGLLEVAGRLPSHAYGLHVWAAQYPSRQVTTRPGAMMASSDTMTVVVEGRGGHGSAPHQALDPVPVLAEMVIQAQVLVAREFDVFDPVVVTCGSLRAGTAANVIPDEATALFTLRSFTETARQRLFTALPRLFDGIAAAHAMTCRVELTELYPVTVNDPDECAFVQAAVEELFPGRWAEMAQPLGAAEDFSKILQRIPGTFVGVAAVEPGTDHRAAAPNHSPRARYDDAVVADCATLLAELALRRLG